MSTHLKHYSGHPCIGLSAHDLDYHSSSPQHAVAVVLTASEHAPPRRISHTHAPRAHTVRSVHLWCSHCILHLGARCISGAVHLRCTAPTVHWTPAALRCTVHCGAAHACTAVRCTVRGMRLFIVHAEKKYRKNAILFNGTYDTSRALSFSETQFSARKNADCPTLLYKTKVGRKQPAARWLSW